MKYDLEIVIPVFHEEGNIYETLEKILEKVKLNYRIIVVYDYSEDPTVKIIKDNFSIDKIFLLKNKYKGFNGAIKSAFEITNSRAALLYPADENDNFDFGQKSDSLWSFIAREGLLNMWWLISGNNGDDLTFIVGVKPRISISIDNSLDIKVFKPRLITLINDVLNKRRGVVGSESLRETTYRVKEEIPIKFDEYEGCISIL